MRAFSVVLVSPGVSTLGPKDPPATVAFLTGGGAQAAKARHEGSLAPSGLAWPGLGGNGWGWQRSPREVCLPGWLPPMPFFPPARVLRREAPDCCASLFAQALRGLGIYQDIGTMAVFVEVGLVASAASLRAGGGKLGCGHEAEGRGEARRALCGPSCLLPGL